MANGDVTHTDVEGFLQLGYPLPETSNTTMTAGEADALCNEVNSEVNLWLKRLGFALPITDADSLTWLQFTKTLGASAYILEGLMAQDVEQDNTRATRLWDQYEKRLQVLRDTGGEILDAARQTSPRPCNVPILVGEYDDAQRKRFLRFPQRAAADQYDDEAEIADTDADWVTAIRGL